MKTESGGGGQVVNKEAVSKTSAARKATKRRAAASKRTTKKRLVLLVIIRSLFLQSFSSLSAFLCFLSFSLVLALEPDPLFLPFEGVVY